MIRYFCLTALISGIIGTRDLVNAQKPIIRQRPIPSWVVSIGYDKTASPKQEEESGTYYLLLDEQEHVGLQESFAHYAYKLMSAEGLQQMADLAVDFNPAYEQLTFHNITIHRNGEIIDRMPAEIQTIQREQSMDRFLYDGSVTAVIHLNDARVGDVIEYSFTKKGYNPVYDGHVGKRIALSFNVPIKKSFQRILVPQKMNVLIKYINTNRSAVMEVKEGNTVYTLEGTEVKAVLRDSNEPDWYDPHEYLVISNFATWADVSRWATKRYVVTMADMEKLKRLSNQVFAASTSEEFVLQTVRFVQDEVRYLGFESGLNSHQPHAPPQVFEQRFGDCKDKSLLLVALLKMRGVNAHPILVNSYLREHVSELPPMINAFNHCVVQIDFNGKLIYIDPTISSQGGTLESIYFPTYQKGLIIREGEAELSDLPPPSPSSVHERQNFQLGSIGGEAILEIQTLYQGADADIQRSFFANNDRQSIQKNYLTFYGNLYPDIETTQPLTLEDDRANNQLIIKEFYRVSTFWKPTAGRPEKIFCEFYAQGLETYFNVTKSAVRSAPYRLAFPLDYRHEIHVKLPEEWNVTPEKTTLRTDYYNYTFEVNYSEQAMMLKTTYSTKKESIPTSFFKKFVEDHGVMMNNLSYSLSYDQLIAEKESSKTPGILVNIMLLIIGAILVYWLYVHYNPPAVYPPPGKPIGGWLILVAIGISLSPIRLFYDLATTEDLLTGLGWLRLWYAEQYFAFGFVLLTHIYNIIFLMFLLVMVILFFQRRSSVPKLAIYLYGIGLFMIVTDNLVAKYFDPDTSVDTQGIVRAFVAAAIWIPYFLLSDRVKETFVNTYEQ